MKKTDIIRTYPLKALICSIMVFSACDFIYSQTTGTVFRDFNGNGIQETATSYSEPGVSGLIVNAYNSSNTLVASFSSNASGLFSIPLSGTAYNGIIGSGTGFIANGVAVRLEFVIPASGTCGLNPQFDYSSGNSAGTGSSVRFVNGGANNINYAINDPTQYVSGTSPFSSNYIFSVIQTTGNPLVSSGTSGAANAFVKFPYNRSGSTALSSSDILAKNKDIGTTYGIAYSKQAHRVFVSAFMKRHGGFGPANGTFNHAPGAIYIIDPSKNHTTGAASFFISLDALGIPTHNSSGVPAYGSGSSFTVSSTGSGINKTETVTYINGGNAVIGDNTARGLQGNINITNNDAAAYDQAGKLSLGDMEISDDGQYLFIVNLFDRKIYQLQLNSITNPTSASVVTSWQLPNPPLRSSSGITGANVTYSGANDNTDFYTGARGLQRPFALKYYRGKLYVGSVTTGEGSLGTSITDNNTGTPEYTDLWGYVWEINPSSGFTSAPVLQFPLNFSRGIDADNIDETWNTWTNTLPQMTGAYSLGGYYGYPQPILSCIEFDVDGSMIVGFRDRAGDQAVTDGYTLTGTDYITVEANGDLLRAYRSNSCNSWTLESNGDKDGPGGYAAITAQKNGHGPGGGEFYYQDGVERFNGSASGITLWHNDVSTGSVCMISGSNQVVTTTMDPQSLFSGGVSWMNNNTGANPRDYLLYAGSGIGDMGKSNGMGDIEMLTGIPPVEIGNRVWLDVDRDGIQDAGEPGIQGVEVELVDASTSAVIAVCTTDANGNYLFISGGSSVAGTGVVTTSLLPGANYIVRIKGILILNGSYQVTGNAYNFVANNLFISPTDIAGNGETDWSDNDGANISGRYQVTVTAREPGKNNHTVDFGFAPAVPLASVFTAFNAVKYNNRVASLITWNIQNQGNILGYSVQRSADGNLFSTIENVPDVNKQQYRFIDNSPFWGLNYYRLAVFYKNGQVLLSETAMVNFTGNDKLTVYPNPVNNVLNIHLPDEIISKPADIHIYTADGKLVFSMHKSSVLKKEAINTSSLPGGSYYLKITANGSVHTANLFVQH